MKKVFNVVRLICLSVLELRYLLVGVSVRLFRGKISIKRLICLSVLELRYLLVGVSVLRVSEALSFT